MFTLDKMDMVQQFLGDHEARDRWLQGSPGADIVTELPGRHGVLERLPQISDFEGKCWPGAPHPVAQKGQLCEEAAELLIARTQIVGRQIAQQVNDSRLRPLAVVIDYPFEAGIAFQELNQHLSPMAQTAQCKM